MLMFLASLALGAEIQVSSAPTEVTVYRAQARVSRASTVALKPGRHTVVFEGLPASLDMESVTASVKGSAVVDGVDVKRIPAKEVADERVRALNEEITRLARRKAALSDERQTYLDELAALAASRTATSAQLNQQLLVADRAPERVRGTLSALRVEEERARAARRDLDSQIVEVDLEVQALLRERNELGSSATDTFRASVNLDVARAGNATITLDTLVRGASWTPVYDLRGDATGGVELALSAQVKQRTGEDWSKVKLTVSSAQPGRGTDAPRLDPFWLQRPRPVSRSYSDSRDAMADSEGASAPKRKSSASMAPPAPPPAPMEVATAVVEQQLSATSFTVERAENVASDGSERKVLLTTVELEADLRHVVVPRLDPKAYLVGEVTNSAGFPLLPGDAGVFLGGAYVGTFGLSLAAPGDTFDVAFGADERLTVARRPERIEVGKGQPGKKAKATWEWKVTVNNGHSGPVKVQVLEQAPLSANDSVTVELLGDAPEERDAQNRLTFEGKVPAKASSEWSWGYQVTYPSELSLGWLE